jgi:hypothetical protein
MSIEAYDYGKQDGIAEERERIIKLLEDLIKERSGVNLQGAIALIKKEK